jgi:hypothetical protein
MHAGFVHTGAAGCLAQPPAADAPAYRNTCASAIEHFRNDFGCTKSLFPWLNPVPLAIGAFIGAPLLAREVESGTWQLAWTQAVPRVRWLTVKLVTLAALAVVLDGAFSVLVTWYRQPWDALNGRFGGGFDFEGLTLPVYALFAFAVGTAAGAPSWSCWSSGRSNTAPCDRDPCAHCGNALQHCRQCAAPALVVAAAPIGRP